MIPTTVPSNPRSGPSVARPLRTRRFRFISTTLSGRVEAQVLADRRARLAPRLDDLGEHPGRGTLVRLAQLEGPVAVELAGRQPLEEPVDELAGDHPLPSQARSRSRAIPRVNTEHAASGQSIGFARSRSCRTVPRFTPGLSAPRRQAPGRAYFRKLEWIAARTPPRRRRPTRRAPETHRGRPQSGQVRSGADARSSSKA